MKKKDTMTIRREWLNEVLDTLEMLEEKAETNGESRLMYEIMKVIKENIEIREIGGNALFCRRAAGQVCAFSIIPQPPAFCQGFFVKKTFFYFSQNA
jgi:hypothetical protein